MEETHSLDSYPQVENKTKKKKKKKTKNNHQSVIEDMRLTKSHFGVTNMLKHWLKKFFGF